MSEPSPRPRRNRVAKAAGDSAPKPRAARRRPAMAAALPADQAAQLEQAAQVAPEPEPEPDEQARVLPQPEATGREAPSGGVYDLVWRTGVLSVLAIARRELAAFFVSPIGYVVAALLAPLVAYVGYLTPVRFGSPVNMEQVYADVIFFSLLIAPLFTMRQLAEERRQGTLEVLLTSPVRDWELVIGKWLAALVFYVLVTAFVFVIVGLLIYYQPAHQVLHPLGLTISVGNLDLGPVLAGYVGMLLAGGSFLAIGLLWSSVTQNQIIAAFAGFVSLIVLYVVFGFGAFAEPPVSDVVSYLSAGNHYNSFNQGQIVLKDVVYFATLIVGALFLTTRVLDSRRWR